MAAAAAMLLLLLLLRLLLLLGLLLLVPLRRWRRWYKQSWAFGLVYRKKTERVRAVVAGAWLPPPSEEARSLRRAFPLQT